MKIAIASDHGGFSLKQILVPYILKNFPSHQLEDLGCTTEVSVDFPDFAAPVAKKVSEGLCDRGILICGTGVGMAITANKFKGVRASSVMDLFTARLTREHNDLNVLCLGGRVIGPAVAEEIVKLFLDTPFAGGRHATRVGKINLIEK